MNRAEILIIDDEPQMRKLVEITVEGNGYLSKSAVSAKEGLIMASNHPPDLIILDLGLPDESTIAVSWSLTINHGNGRGVETSYAARMSEGRSCRLKCVFS